MKLSEEIADLLAKRYFEVGFFPTLEAYPADLEIAEELVNKVLDAAVESAEQCKSTCYIDGKLEYVVIPLAQIKAKLQALKTPIRRPGLRGLQQ